MHRAISTARVVTCASPARTMWSSANIFAYVYNNYPLYGDRQRALATTPFRRHPSSTAIRPSRILPAKNAGPSAEYFAVAGGRKADHALLNERLLSAALRHAAPTRRQMPVQHPGRDCALSVK